MSGIIFTVAALLAGVAILAGGLYYLLREKEDPESRKVYSIASAVGAIIVICIVVKIVALGF